MALKLGELFYDIDANTKGLESASEKVTKENKKMSASFKKLGAVIAAALTIDAARRVIMLADSYTSLKNKIVLVTKNQKEFNKVFKDLQNIANEVGVSFDSTVTLFQRLSNATKSLSISTEDLTTVTSAITKTLIISTATAEETKSAIIQLSQGLAAGALRGEEFNSVIDAAPRLLDALGDSLGKTRGELRAMAFDGKLTTEIIVKALKQQAGAIDAEFKTMQRTVGQSLEVLKNSIGQAVSEFDNITGATSGIADFITNIADIINNNWHDALIDSLVFFKKIEIETRNIRTISQDISNIFIAMAKSDAVKGLHSLWTTFYEKIALSSEAMGQALGNITGLLSEQVSDTKELNVGQEKLNQLKEIELKIEKQKDLLRKNQSSSPLDMITSGERLSSADIKENIKMLEKQKEAINSNSKDTIKAEKIRVEESKKSNDQILSEYRKHLEDMSTSQKAFDKKGGEKGVKKLVSDTVENVSKKPLTPETQSIVDSLKSETEKMKEAYEERRLGIAESENLNLEEKKKWQKRNEQEFAESMDNMGKEQKLQEQQLLTQRQTALVSSLQSITSLNNMILNEMQSAGKEQTAQYKALFYANKAIQVAQMIASAFVAAANMKVAIPGPPGIIAAAGVLAVGLAEAAIVSSLAINQGAGGGRLAGGQVNPGSIHQVNENGQSELLEQGGKQFLLTGSKGGNVVPSNKMKAGSGNSVPSVTIINQGAPMEATVQRMTDDEIVLLARNAENGAVARVNQSLARGSGTTNNALNNRNAMTRRAI